MILQIDGIDVTEWLDRDAELRPGRESLTDPIRTYELTLMEVRAPSDLIPIAPRYGLPLDVYDETPTLVFSGRISTLSLLPLTGATGWRIGAQSWAVRLFETDTGSLDLSGASDTDREHVIAILNDAFRENTFGLTVDDDPIYAANAPDWPGVQATGITNGHDYSYMQTHDALRLLMRDMPGVSIQVRADLVVEYGTAVQPAHLALCTFAAPSADFLEVLDQSYSEQEIVGDHRNRLRLGGVGAAEATAVDNSSVARFGRYLDAPYTNDEDIPAADVERIAYARLSALRVRLRTAAAVTVDPTTYATAVMADGPIAYWRLGEKTGTTAIDSAGDDHHGAYAGSPELGVQGGSADAGTVTRFDGVDDSVTLPADAALDLTGAITIEALVRPEDFADNRTIYSRGSASAASLQHLLWFVTATGIPRFFVGNGTTTANVFAPAAAVPGQLTHIVGVYDGAAITIYQDNVQGPVNLFAGPLMSYVATVPRIGRRGNTADDYFKGAMGDVALYDYALSAAQVAAHFAAASLRGAPLVPGQVVQVYSDLSGPFEPDGFAIDGLSWYAPSRFDVQIDQDERPEMILQELEREIIGPGPHQINALQLGDAVLDYATALSRRVGGTTEEGI